MEEDFTKEDDADDEAEAQQRERERAARAAARAAKRPHTLDAGGGLYFWERAWLAAQRAWATLNFQEVPPSRPLGSSASPAKQAH